MSHSPKRLLAEVLRNIGQTPQARAFADQVVADLSGDDLADLSQADLVSMATDLWTFAQDQPGTAAKISCMPVAAGRGLDRLQILQTDVPFLVDSVMGEIADQGLTVRAMVHPILQTGTRRMSAIQVLLEPVGDDRRGSLVAGLEATLADVHQAVSDFAAMTGQLADVTKALASAPPYGQQPEDLAFLSWLAAEHFVFLGSRVYDYPKAPDGSFLVEEPVYEPGDSLGVLRDPERRVLRRSAEPAILATNLTRRLAEPTLSIAKANLKSRVHRRVAMDYVGVKRFDAAGQPCGETRFVGLFTALAYHEPTAAVPLVRAKVAHILNHSGALPGSHNAKRLRAILEAYPRDELFQASETELATTATAILHLNDRPRVRLFARRDRYDRFVSVLLFVPRERYDSQLRAKAGSLIARAYGGQVSAFYPDFSDQPLARVRYVIDRDQTAPSDPDLTALEAQIVQLTRTWSDAFGDALRTHRAGPGQVARDLTCYGEAFPIGYRDLYDARDALDDIAVMETMAPDQAVAVRAYRRQGDPGTHLRFKLYRTGGPAPLADILPIFENMGLKALVETGFAVSPDARAPIWIHDFELEDPRGGDLVFEDIKPAFEQAFVAIWLGQTENDGFNRLVLELSISWRDAALIRALARYRLQSGLDPSQPVQEAALSRHPGVTRLILDLFQTRFHPAIQVELSAREEQSDAVMAEILAALQWVESLDDDRVLRRMALLVAAIQRTNYYQRASDGQPKAYISFKVASRELADLPLPKPFREIFVWATHVEGVHLRFGPVARGGLRWSDRRDDFRTEVLALAKAQNTKNAVIVPVGSKGGFFPKALPAGSTPDQVRDHAILAYKTFLCGLLDLTDNLTSEGGVVHPEQVVIHDDDDPYLVVAADKGTATFSDIANGVADDYDFWLGDAFASGGSVGYDHKVMGITARGAWEAIKRHFRELGTDIQTESFSVVGVGDMSGDVFGNGMLLSPMICLKAAFDHRHIFLDPDPDPAAAFVERARMFALPRSSWQDYDRTRISVGGGVFPRNQKSIPLTLEVRQMLDLGQETATPAELMGAILKARADLLYLGGVGTYVKATQESHLEVGDKANDGLRINGSDLRVKVVGEGANLGLTQAARIEFALAGGRLNTDAIDNSAGVDSSDHEVNIKILTGMLERTGGLTRARRNKLLASMTKDVADHVLVHNVDQTLALSLMDRDAPDRMSGLARFMDRLETSGRLDRVVEGLPGRKTMAERKAVGLGLTRPEAAVLLAYGKLELSDELLEGAVPDDPHFAVTLEGYFPKPLRKYGQALHRHRLKRDIVATVLANDMVNRLGPEFAARAMAEAGCDLPALISGYETAKASLDIVRLWSEVATLDVPRTVPATAQLALFAQLARNLAQASIAFARRAGGRSISGVLDHYQSGLEALRKLGIESLSAVERARLEAVVQSLIEQGAPAVLAAHIANLEPLTRAADLVDLARGEAASLDQIAQFYHQLGGRVGFDQIRAGLSQARPADEFEASALAQLGDDLLADQARLARSIMDQADGLSPWEATHGPQLAKCAATLAGLEAAPGPWTFARLSLARAALLELG